jgi:hypothetical protein
MFEGFFVCCMSVQCSGLFGELGCAESAFVQSVRGVLECLPSGLRGGSSEVAVGYVGFVY